MLAFLAVEFDPAVDPRTALCALRQPTLTVIDLDLDLRHSDVIASVEVPSAEALAAASERVARWPGVRSSTAFPVAAQDHA